MDMSINVHTDENTIIKRNPPTDTTPGGWIVIGDDHYTSVTLFAPKDNPVGFWRYLAGVAQDMATYTEVHNERG